MPRSKHLLQPGLRWAACFGEPSDQVNQHMFNEFMDPVTSARSLLRPCVLFASDVLVNVHGANLLVDTVREQVDAEQRRLLLLQIAQRMCLSAFCLLYQSAPHVRHSFVSVSPQPSLLWSKWTTLRGSASIKARHTSTQACMVFSVTPSAVIQQRARARSW